MKNAKKIGLFDIDDHSLRLLIIKGTKQQVLIVDQLEFTHAENLFMLIKKIKTETGLAEGIILLRDSLVMIKNFSLNVKLNNKDTNRFLRVNIEKEFQCSLSDIIYSYEWLENLSTDSLRVVVAKKELIRDFTQLFLHAGLQLKTIDVESLVVERVMKLVYATTMPYVVFLFREQRVVQLFIIQGIVKLIQELPGANIAECDSSALALMQRFYRVCCEYQTEHPAIILCGGSSFVSKLVMHFFKLNEVYCSIFNTNQLQNKFHSVDQHKISNHAYLMCIGLLLRKFS